MAISDKLTYLNETKSQIRTGINAIGGELTAEDTFRSYVDALNDIYNYLPKVSSQGTILTLNNTINGRMNIELGTSELEQETTTGKNLFNKVDYSTLNVWTNGNPTNLVKNTNNITFTTSSSDYCGIYFNAQNVPSYIKDFDIDTTYVLSVDVTASSTIDFRIGGETPKTESVGTTKTRIYVSTKFPGAITFYKMGTTSGTTIKLENIMVSLSNDTTYEPYTNGPAPNPSFPMPIHTISGNNKVFVEGSNILKNNATSQTINELTFVVNNDKSITVSGTPNANTNFTILGDTSVAEEVLLLKANTTYYNSTGIRLVYRLTNGDYGAIDSGIYTPTTDKSIRHIYLSFTSGTSINATYYPMISLGNTATTYEPYVSQEANINLGDIEYCEIGDYKDEFVRDNEGNWGIRKNIGKVVFTGSSSDLWGVNSVWDSEHPTILHIFNNNLLSLWKIGQTGFKSNYFICTTQTERDMDEEMITCHTTTATPYIFIKYSRLTGVSSSSTVAEKVNAFNSWLSTHNVSLYYILETPTYTPITGTLAEQLENIYQYLLSYKEQTNISQINNDLPFVISASALLDLNTLVGE